MEVYRLEDKKAIEDLKDMIEKSKDLMEEEFYKLATIHNIQAVATLINLIEKQFKEIEELKEYKHDAELTKVACCSAQNCEALNNCIKLERELQNADKKWEDKIKAKIEEIDKEIEKKREIARNPMDRVSGRLLTDSIVELEKTKQVLQSLLEKE